MCSRGPLLTALLLTALWGGEDPSGEGRNPILFRQYGFLCLGFVLVKIKARNGKNGRMHPLGFVSCVLLSAEGRATEQQRTI